MRRYGRHRGRRPGGRPRAESQEEQQQPEQPEQPGGLAELWAALQANAPPEERAHMEALARLGSEQELFIASFYRGGAPAGVVQLVTGCPAVSPEGPTQLQHCAAWCTALRTVAEFLKDCTRAGRPLPDVLMLSKGGPPETSE